MSTPLWTAAIELSEDREFAARFFGVYLIAASHDISASKQGQALLTAYFNARGLDQHEALVASTLYMTGFTHATENINRHFDTKRRTP